MNAMDSTQCTPSLSQAIRMKKLSESGKLTEAERVDFPKLCEESVLEEGVSDEDTAD